MKRKGFIKTGAFTSATRISIIPSTVKGSTLVHSTPSDQVNLACCSVGHRRGVLAQRLNTKLEFDGESKQITNNPLTKVLLVGAPSCMGLKGFYNL